MLCGRGSSESSSWGWLVSFGGAKQWRLTRQSTTVILYYTQLTKSACPSNWCTLHGNWHSIIRGQRRRDSCSKTVLTVMPSARPHDERASDYGAALDRSES